MNEYDEQNSTIISYGRVPYQNLLTGEVEEFDSITKKVRDRQNFWKIVLMDFLAILGVFDSKQVDIFVYVIMNTNPGNNLFIGTYKKIGEGTGISKPTIVRTFKKLQANNFVKMVQRGVWRVNPNIMMKGDVKKKNIILSYYEEKTQNNKDLPKIKAAKKAAKKAEKEAAEEGYSKEDEMPLPFDEK